MYISVIGAGRCLRETEEITEKVGRELAAIKLARERTRSFYAWKC